MQHEMMRHPVPPPGADNVGDVLASIRRLIAQDEVGCRLPNQALNALPGPDIAPRILAEPMLSAVPGTAATVTPLVLESNDLVAAPAIAESEEAPEAGTADPTSATAAEAEARFFSDWLKMPLTAPAEPDPVAAGPEGETQETAAAEAAEPSPDTGFEPVPIQPFGPFLEDSPTTTVQMEETMLHVNASVTPINPLAEAHAAAEALNRENEAHLFAPQGKDTQKGAHLRGMIREAIRQELQGEIGTRLSRNLQQMIRNEIELTLRQMCEEE